VAFFDHVYAVLDGPTAEAIAGSEFLRGFGRLEMHTTVADGETWTGRYLLGRSTYVELFGPGDVEPPDDEQGSTGIGLSPRAPGGLEIIAERMKEAGTPVEVERKTRRDGDQDVPWFDSVSLSESEQSFELWVMEYLVDPTDRQRREAAYVEWAGGSGATPRAETSFIGDVSLVELGASAEAIALAEPLLEAAGYALTRSADMVLARDDEITIRLLPTSRCRRSATHRVRAGRSRTVGAGGGHR
jgi:hypothetical protein